MISSINSGIQSGIQIPQQRSEQSLTTVQQSIISETLTQFDPDNLTEAEALSIVPFFFALLFLILDISLIILLKKKWKINLIIHKIGSYGLLVSFWA